MTGNSTRPWAATSQPPVELPSPDEFDLDELVGIQREQWS